MDTFAIYHLMTCKGTNFFRFLCKKTKKNFYNRTKRIKNTSTEPILFFGCLGGYDSEGECKGVLLLYSCGFQLVL